MAKWLGLVALAWGCGAGKGGEDLDADADVDTDADGDADGDVDPDCIEDPHRAGCRCDTLEPEICYGGPAGTLGMGSCRAGVQSCVDGRWSLCNGQLLPTDEVCNLVDDDCDGQTDEGVQSACGDCNLDCEQTCVGVGCDPFAPDEATSSGMVEQEDGALCVESVDGWYTHVFDGCGDPGMTGWISVAWEAEFGAGGSLEVHIRLGDADSLADAPWTPLAFDPGDDSPARIEVEGADDCQFDLLEVRATLHAPVEPVCLRSLDAAHFCYCPIG